MLYIVFPVMALLMLMTGLKTSRSGISITQDKKLEGKPARIAAIAMFVVAALLLLYPVIFGIFLNRAAHPW
jgi:hypothetical protein